MQHEIKLDQGAHCSLFVEQGAKVLVSDDLPCVFPYARFHPVVGGGANGSVIHYSRNDRKVRTFLSLIGYSCISVLFSR